MKTYIWHPRWGVSTQVFFPVSGSFISEALYTSETIVTASQRNPWRATFSLQDLSDDDAREIESLLMTLDGGANLVRLYDHRRIVPRGIAAGIHQGNYLQRGTGQFGDGDLFDDGDGFVNGSVYAFLARNHRRGEQVAFIEGLVPSQSVSIAVGDAIEIDGYRYQARHSVSSNADGKALVPIHPPLRKSTLKKSLGAKVVFAYASSPFVMATPFRGFDTSPPVVSSAELSFVEFLPRQ